MLPKSRCPFGLCCPEGDGDGLREGCDGEGRTRCARGLWILGHSYPRTKTTVFFGEKKSPSSSSRKNLGLLSNLSNEGNWKCFNGVQTFNPFCLEGSFHEANLEGSASKGKCFVPPDMKNRGWVYFGSASGRIMIPMIGCVEVSFSSISFVRNRLRILHKTPSLGVSGAGSDRWFISST